MNDEYKTLGQIINEPATQFGSRELDSGNPHAWSAEKERQFEQDISDVQRNYTVTTEDLKNYIDANPVSTGEKIALGLEQVGTQMMDAYRGLDQLIAKSPAMFPALTEKEKDDMVALTMHNYEAFTKARQDLINRKGVADSVWFNGANVLGQVALTSVTGLLTGGSTVPIVMGGVQEFGRKSGDYALKYAQATGDYSLKDQSVKDDMVALAYAGISAAIERGIGAERVLDGVIAQGALKQLGKAALGEAAEEFTQEIAEYMSDMTLDFMTNKSIYNDRTPMEAFKDALTGAVYGALGGGTMGFGMYYAHRNILQKQFENAGYAPADAKQMAINAVDTAKDVVLREIITRDQLEKKYGQAYQDLVNKAYNTLKETNNVFGVRPEKENIGELNMTDEQRKAYDAGQPVILNEQQLRQYADTTAAMLARQVMVVAAMQGTSTDMVLQLSDIEQIGNVMALNTPDMHNDVVVRRLQAQNKALQQKLKHERDLKKARNEGFQDEDDRIAILQAQQAALQKQLDNIEKQDQLDIEIIKKNNGGIDISARAYADAAALKNATNADEFYKNLSPAQQAITPADQIQARYEEAILADIAGSPKEYRRLFAKGKISPQVRTNLLTNIAALRSTGLAGIQGDIKRALDRIAAGCTLDNFAITFGNVRDENDINPFATAFVTYVLLSDPAGATQTVDLLAEKVNTVKQNIRAGITTTQYQDRADIMSEALRESPLTAEKWDGDTTTDPNLLMLYDQKNVVNFAVQKAQQRAAAAQARIKATKDQYKIRYATDESLRKALLDNNVLTDPKIAQKYSHAALVKLFRDSNLSADLLEQKSAAEIEQDTRNAQARKAAREYKTVKSLFWSTKKMQYIINRQFAEDNQIDKAFGVDLKYFQKDGGIQDWAEIQMTLSDNGLVQDNPNTDYAQSEWLEQEAKRLIESNVPLNAEAAAQLDIAAEEDRQRHYMESELLATGNFTQDELNKMDLAELDAALQDIRDIQAAAATELDDVPFQEQVRPYTAATINIDGKERPTTNSNGDPIALTEQGLRNFYKWFGDSKVVDEQGRPMVVYHGAHTDERFESFFQDATIWATPNKEYAETYRWDKKGNAPIYSLYMKVKNLKTIGSIEENLTDENIKNLATATGIPYQELLSAIDNSNIFLGDRQNSSIWVFTRSKTFQNLAKKYGIDGIKAQENYYGDGNPKLVDTYATFNSYNVKSTNNRGTFALDDDNIYYQAAYTSGSTYYDRPSTEYVLRGGEGQIVHGWGIYSLADQATNKRRYREGQFSGQLVFVPKMPTTEQLIKGAKTSKESQIIKTVLDSIAAKTPINMYKPIKFAGGVSSYIPLFYVDAMYELLGSKANKADKAFLDKIILEKGQLADETVFKIEPEMSDWMKTAIQKALDEHNDKHSVFYQKDLPYVFSRILVFGGVDKELTNFVKKNFKHKDLNAAGNKALVDAIVNYVQDGGRIEYEPFDNSIFKESGATTLKFEKTAQEMVEKLKDTLDGGFRETRVDNDVKTNPELYGGYLGMLILARYSAYRPITELFNKINDDETTFDNIAKDDDYKYMIGKEAEATTKMLKNAHIMSAYDVFTPIVQSANKIYKSKEFNETYGHETAANRTRIALSQAFRDLTQSQLDNLAAYTFTTFKIPENSLETFISILQNPQNIKTTRGQQLKLEVPEDDMLLDEDLPLAKQASADKLREIVKDFHWSFSRAFVDNIREKDWIKKHLDSDWKLFASKHGIKEKTLAEFAEKLDNEFFNGTMVDTLTPERELFIDYIMQTMHGEGLYQAIADILPETYVELESGEEIGEVKDYDGKQYSVMGAFMPAELARDVALFLNDQGIKGITYTGGIDGRGYVTFSDEAIQTLERMDDDKPMYYQGKRKGGAFDPITKQVILSRNSNTGTLPHEIAHFWLNEMFNRMQNNPNLPAQGKAMWDGLKRMLNITDDQTELTRDQHEQFATSAEAYIFNKTPLPKGTEPAYKEFLAYVPESYYTFMNMGWTGSDGQFHNPMLTEDDMHWFDSFFTGTGIIESAPVQTKVVSSNEPVKVSIMDGRKVMLDDAQTTINNAGDKLEMAVKESIPAASKVQIANTQNTIVKTADESLQIPAINNDDKPDSKPAFSFLHRGRGTDTREEQLELTRKWAQEHWDEALAFALTDPAYSTNPSPADPATLIRVVAELNTDMTIKDQLNTNFALMMSQQGKSGGLNNDTHNSFFLKGLGQIQQNLANKYALARYGTTKDAVERFDIEVKQFINQHLADLQANRITVQEVMKQAAEIFGRDENADISEEINTLFQELPGQGTIKSSFVKEIQKVIKKRDEARQERITLAEQMAKNGKLGEYLAHLVKVQAGAEMDTKTKAEFNAAATRAQVASTQLDSDDPDTATAAAQIIHEYHKRIGQTETAQNWADKVIGGYESRAMLSGATTISKNLVGNEIELAVVTGALRSKYGQNDVSDTAIKAETDRLTKIYESSLLSIPQMENLTDKSLVHGEAYGIGDNSVTVAGVQVRTIGKTKIPDPLAVLGRSDFYFRRNVYLKSLAYQASAYARKHNLNATDVFNQWKKLSNNTPDGIKARKEAVLTAHSAVFTQNGALAEALNKVRNVLNRAVPLGTQYGLGNMIAPFVKTPANIVELGARALVSPFSSTWQYMKTGELDVAHRVDLGNLGVALLILAATVIAGGGYEPPYQPGLKYDPTKPYDSIRIAGVWIKLDTLGPLTTPLRLMLSAVPGISTSKNAWKRGVAGTFGDIPFDLDRVKYAITNPAKGGINWVEGEIDKAIPTIVSDWAKVGGHMAGISIESPTPAFGNKTIRKIGMDGQNPSVNDWIRAVGLGIIRIDENN